MAFPAGMSLITVRGHLDGPNGKFASGDVKVEAERKIGFNGSPWIMQRVSNWIPTKNGDFAVQLPHSDQSGLIGDNGLPVTNIGYKITFRPLRDTVIQTLAWQTLPLSYGAEVNLSALADLGGWPNQTVVITPAPGGGTGSNVTYVESPPGSGLFIASVS